MGGVIATGTVVRGGNREVTVEVPLVCLHPDGQYKYEVTAVAKVVIPFGDPVPVFVPNGRPRSWVPGEQPAFKVEAHTVCRDSEGRVKWEADTEPVELPSSAMARIEAMGANVVVTARPKNPFEEDDCGH